MKGILTLTSMGKFDRSVNYDKKLFIVRYATNTAKIFLNKYGFTHVMSLSPSAPLYDKFRGRWKHGNYNKEEMDILVAKYNSLPPDDAWWYLYAPEFYKELSTDELMIRSLKHTVNLLTQGKDIVMVCYCPNCLRCHRGIIALELIKKYNVPANNIILE